MQKSSIYLFKLFGFEVRLDWSWIFLGVLIAWTLAEGYFPNHFPDLTKETYWAMGLCSTLGLFFSIVLHELCHSLVGHLYGIPIGGITLFIFGGVTQLQEAPSSPKAEFFIAIVGPLFSLLLGLLCYRIALLGVKLHWPLTVTGVFHYLGMLNLALSIFNMLPGFPLDGGRVFRAFLWWWKKDLKWATKIAASGGILLGIVLVLFGVLQFIQGAIIGGVWSVLLGLFLQQISRMSYQELIVKELLQGKTIKRYVNTHPVTVSPTVTLQSLIENYFYRYHHKFYPVLENDELVGVITIREAKQAPEDQWPVLQVKDIMQQPLSSKQCLHPNAPAVAVLQKMTTTGITRMVVTEQDKLYGIITLHDLISLLEEEI